MSTQGIWLIVGNLLALILITVVLANKYKSRQTGLAYLAVANAFYIGSVVYFYGGAAQKDTYIFFGIIALLDFLTLKIIYFPNKVSVDEEKYKQWHDDPKNWKLGIFYFNPEDKRIFPPKRFEGMGWTINFAYTDSILVMMTIIAMIVVVINVLKIFQ